ncbi:MAG: Re/Si-specific NAD(P)(+) transhydrogenase subunit alpha [Actinobacteria bacterium]|nr:Re/Si-specific NAD(P)(+) transhydrogenase subunit alpha [Actinomycetota bacterium]
MSEASAAPSVVLGVPAESRAGERRVAMSPAALGPLIKAGARVIVESGAGAQAGFTDAAFADKGAVIGTRDEVFAADVLLMVRTPDPAHEPTEVDRLKPSHTVVGMAAPFAAPEAVSALAAKGVTLFSLELVPRTTRAQSMDVLSSQANIAGYKAVLLAAEALPKLFPLMTTAAGTIPPAKVLVIGAGVAGLSAIATSRRLGAVVEAYDVRPAVKEEIESLGARFVELPLETGQEGGGSGAYAQQLSEEQLKKQQELLAKTVAKSDVVITTAQVQGAKAPVIVTQEMVAAMAPGSVIVDLAAEQGGNCAATVAGEHTDVGGVNVIGPVNVPSTVPTHSSLMYGKNVANFVQLMLTDGGFNRDVDDDVIRESMVIRDGEVRNNRVREMLGLQAIAEPAPPEPEPEPSAESTEVSS